MLDFTLLTPALSNRRGSLVLLQLIVFIMRKSCVDTCVPTLTGKLKKSVTT